MKRTTADGNNDLVIPDIKHKSFGGRSVGYGGPNQWPEYLTERTKDMHEHHHF